MVAGADAMEQVLDPRGGVGDAELLPDPGPHLVGVVEGPLGDLLPEPIDLSGPQPTGIAPVVQRAQLLQALVAEDAEPVADLATGDAQQLGDLLPGAPLIDPQEGGEALEDAAVVGLPSSFTDLLPLLSGQPDDLHRPPSLPPLRLRPPRR